MKGPDFKRKNTIPANRPATYEDLNALPDTLVGEILDGELVTHPRPASRHALAASVLGSLVVGSFGRKSADGPGDWWILGEPECHLGADVVVPDIAGWRKSTMPEFPDAACFDITPDWVCEVTSPSTLQYDRTVKRDIYARDNVSHYWIVDPVARFIEVFALKKGQWVLLSTVRNEVRVSLEPFEQMPFDLSELWI